MVIDRPHKKSIGIIGAGPAGLTAGYKLLQQSNGQYDITILEESDIVGGISKTVCHNGNRMDIGGHRFFSKNSEVNKMWLELMPLQGAPANDDIKLSRKVKLHTGGPDPEFVDTVMLWRKRISRIYYCQHFFDYPLKLNFNTILNMGLMTTFCVGSSYLKARATRLPETSLENFYINRFGRKLYGMFFESYTEKLWGRHPTNISAAWGAQRVKGLSLVSIFTDILHKMLPYAWKKDTQTETSLIESFMYPKYGPGQLWQIVATQFIKMGGKIIFNAKAKGVNKYDERISSIIYENEKTMKELKFDYVISSMPLKDLVLGMNDVPNNIREIADGLPYRDFVTVGLLVDRLKLRNTTKLKTLNNIIPDCWIYVQDKSVRLGRIQIFNNWSPYMVKSPTDNIWLGLEYFCSEGDKQWELTEDEWMEKGVSELVKIGVIDNDVIVKDFHVEKVKKAYPAYFDTYSQIDKLVTFLNSIKNLYCIGRNGQHRYNNMDHSMVTAFKTVESILSGGSSDKSTIWNVNTEMEYHEEK